MSDKKCDHIGFWKAVGPASISSPEKMMAGAILFCSNCGEISVKYKDVPVKPSSPPKNPILRPMGVPRVVIPGGMPIKKGLKN